MTQPTDYVGIYAQLLHARNQYHARGLQPPLGIVQGIQNIETLARARLTPEQQRAAAVHVDNQLTRLQRASAEQDRAAAHQQVASRVDKLVGDLTSGMLNQRRLTREQLETAAKGKAVQLNSPQERLTQEQRDAAIRHVTRRFDPAGKGWGEKEWNKRLDEMTDASPSDLARLTAQYKTTPEKIKAVTARWRDDRVELALRERREARAAPEAESSTAKVDDNTSRRANIIKAFMSSAAGSIDEDTAHGKRSAVGDTVFEDIPPEQLQEGGRRGDIARAFVESEQRGA